MNCDSGDEPKNSLIAAVIGLILIRAVGVMTSISCDWVFILSTREMARYAGKVMAATAVAFIEDPALLEKAQEEHKENVGPKGYEAPIPKDVVPRPISSL